MVTSSPCSTPSSPARNWKNTSSPSVPPFVSSFVSPFVSPSPTSAISAVAATPCTSSGLVTTATAALAPAKSWLHMSTPGTARCVPRGPCVKHLLCSAPVAHRRSCSVHSTASSRGLSVSYAARCASLVDVASAIALASSHAASSCSVYSSGGVDTSAGRDSIHRARSPFAWRSSSSRAAMSADHGRSDASASS